MTETKTCAKCDLTKPLDQFYRRTRRRRNGSEYLAYESVCHECRRATQRISGRSRQSQRNGYMREWYKTSRGQYNYTRRDAIKRGATWDLTYEECLSLMDQPCTYCGAQMQGLHLDRVIPGGPYNLDNVTPCCPDCNRSKATSTPDQWLTKLKLIIDREQAIRKLLSGTQVRTEQS